MERTQRRRMEWLGWLRSTGLASGAGAMERHLESRPGSECETRGVRGA